MKRNSLGKVAAAAACFALVVPPSAFAASPLAAANDVALRQGGLLVGQVVDSQGMPQADAVVSVRQGDHEVVRATTDASGMFAAQGLRGGNYQLQTEDGTCACRLWAADTAPPAAKSAALLVTGSNVVRGQHYGAGVVGWVKAHPYITAGIVAAAIATPLAFIDDDDDDDHGS